jgi:cardiolipin synthase
MVWLMLVMMLFIMQVAFVLFMEFKNPFKTTAWLLIIFLLPGVGFFLYIFMAKEYKRRRVARRRGRKYNHKLPLNILNKIEIASRTRELTNKDIWQQRRLVNLLRSIPDSPITKSNETEIYSNGKETFDSIIRELEKARDHIHMEFYIVHSDDIGTKIQQLLIRKAKEGVSVRFIYDGLGSYDLPARYIKEMTNEGIEVHAFMPIRYSFFKKSANYRNHRKIVVVDGLVGFVGGINIGDEYLGLNPKYGFWRDTHMRIRGDAVYFLQQTFINDWAFVSGFKLTDPCYFPDHTCEGDEQVQIIASGPESMWDTIQELYFGTISTAEKRIWIITPYFIPDISILVALKTAALSGVEVRIILPGLSDHILVKWASTSFIEELMEAGVRFWFYNNGFIHAKVLIVDETIASVGTANLDMRSFFDNFELNAVLFDKKSIKHLEEDFLEDLRFSSEIQLKEFKKRTRYQRGKEVIARMLSPLL